MAKQSLPNKVMARYRDRLRAEGLRPVQLWVPDTRSEAFVAEFQRQAAIVAERESQATRERDEIDALMNEQDQTGWS